MASAGSQRPAAARDARARYRELDEADASARKVHPYCPAVLAASLGPTSPSAEDTYLEGDSDDQLAEQRAAVLDRLLNQLPARARLVFVVHTMERGNWLEPIRAPRKHGGYEPTARAVHEITGKLHSHNTIKADIRLAQQHMRQAIASLPPAERQLFSSWQ